MRLQAERRAVLLIDQICAILFGVFGVSHVRSLLFGPSVMAIFSILWFFFWQEKLTDE
jgi:hypothetical protein